MTRVLTITNMNTVSVQAIFARYDFERGPQSELDHSITLGDIYCLFDEGLSFEEVRARLEQQAYDQCGLYASPIKNRTILLGEAFYHAVNPGIDHFNREKLHSLLIDENLDPHLSTRAAQEVFGRASHVSFEAVAGEPDSVVSEKAREFDVILSKDKIVKASNNTAATKDLTQCIYDMWVEVLEGNGGVIDDDVRNLPVLIHIMDGRASARQIRKWLQKYHADIMDLMETRESPVIQLTANGVQPGKHYVELIHGDIRDHIAKLYEKKINAFFVINPLSLDREELKAISTEVKEYIRQGIEDFVDQSTEFEEAIRILNSMIENFWDYPLMSPDHYRILEQVNYPGPETVKRIPG